MEESAAELVGRNVDSGICVRGGGTLHKGFANLVTRETRMPVISVADPLSTVVRGMQKVLEDEKLLSRVKFTGGLKQLA